MMDDMTAIFREEVRDLLESLERGLLDLKSRPEDMGLVNQVFRDLHTVKGSGAMFGFSELAAFIHEFETVFDQVRSGNLAIGPELLRLALAAKDEIPGLVEGEADPEGRRVAILSGLQGLLGGGPVAAEAEVAAAPAEAGAGEADAGEAVAAGEGVMRLSFRLSGAALAMGARPEIVLDELRGLGAVAVEADLADVPPLDRLDVEACAIGWKMVLPASVTAAQVEEVFLFVDAEWSLEGAATEAAPAVAEAAPVAAAKAAPVAAGAVVKPEVKVEAKVETKSDAKSDAGATIRVPAERLDALMDAVGELVTAEARLTQLARDLRDPALIATAEQITRLAGGLRDATMTMRMVPMRSLVGRFRRLVLDLSDKLGKPVEFRVTGEDTELDKTVIEKLADPLVHVLRNALDHGMELPDARVAAGKPREGLVELVAEHAGAEVLIKVRDDGKGMDPAKLREKAIAKGIITPEAQMTEAQIFALIFEPGFSTAEAVTDLSGRGVGMDVVRRTIDALRGTIQIDSALGRGTTVTLRLPLTLAIIEGLQIEVAGEQYILPMPNVQEIVELPPEKVEPSRTEDFLDVRGGFVPFLRLRQLFDCAGEPGPGQNVVIVRAGDARVGIVVDRIIGTNQTVIKQMSKLHSGVRALSGATLLGNGSIALILDVGHLVGMSRQQGEAPQAARQEVLA
ncbi:chemotaxis protein CheA [Tabrizicola sp. TH137]|uniref:chemotaxis protein CheA n=1 Tax=Tabrizicola sp. TH137 TaxID=2067452 RepID=UPI0020B1C88C|nr:chemotaxis protein CheA [Tabrizicola sp. TH137]